MAALKVELTLRGGQKRTFSEPASDDGSEVNFSRIQQSIQKIQKDVNDALTELVNAEKSSGPQGDSAGQAAGDPSGSDDDDDDGDEDSDKEDEKRKGEDNSHNTADAINSEPLTKKLKT